MKLYKFRPLGTEKDLNRIDEILSTNNFWGSKFFELNDPMEGVFYFPLDINEKMMHLTRLLFSAKNSYKICSFSNVYGFENPLLWGHYANGFKGVAIEIDVNPSEVYQVRYANSILDIKLSGQDADDIVKEILTTKLILWNYENEYRLLRKNEESKQQLGRTTKVYFGNPYGNLYNTHEIQPEAIKNYLDLREKLLEKINKYNIDSSLVKVNGTKVIVDNRDY